MNIPTQEKNRMSDFFMEFLVLVESFQKGSGSKN